MVRFALLSLIILALGGCASFPDDGPTSKAVIKQAQITGDKHYDLVRLDYRVAKTVAANQPEPLSTLPTAPGAYRLGLIDDGDVLAVSIFQLNAQMYGTTGSVGSGDAGESDNRPSGGQGLQLLVDDRGRVSIPYGGDVAVAGLTPGEAATAIQKALKGRLIGPQVLVSVQTSPANSVTVIGEIKSSGLIRISPNNDTLINIIARAGGATKPNGDIIVAITRNGHTTTAPLSLVLNDPAQNIRLSPHDEVRLVYHQRKYSTFGALTKDAQTPIEDDSLSLAGAISRLGGLDSNTANAAAVMLFRFERPEVARALGLTVDPAAVRVPVVYRLDLRDPSGFFVAQNFEVQPDDIIYVPHADFAEARKFFELVTEVTNVGYDVALTTLIK